MYRADVRHLFPIVGLFTSWIHCLYFQTLKFKMVEGWQWNWTSSIALYCIGKGPPLQFLYYFCHKVCFPVCQPHFYPFQHPEVGISLGVQHSVSVNLVTIRSVSALFGALVFLMWYVLAYSNTAANAYMV